MELCGCGMYKVAGVEKHGRWMGLSAKFLGIPMCSYLFLQLLCKPMTDSDLFSAVVYSALQMIT